ncbi:MAG TPA: hypothetical protein VM115_12410 [Vicinamibacterales bacterium]|nr:hypothetical protein [Vicinamibacterales bacterium]
MGLRVLSADVSAVQRDVNMLGKDVSALQKDMATVVEVINRLLKGSKGRKP